MGSYFTAMAGLSRNNDASRLVGLLDYEIDRIETEVVSHALWISDGSSAWIS
jgi:hypothetical protein